MADSADPPPITDPLAPAVIGEGRFLRLVRADGWEWAERRRASGVVAIVAVTAAGELLLTEQRRRAVDARVIDLPAGLAGDEVDDEALATAAGRELTEEVGHVAASFSRLAAGPPSPGMSSEVVTLMRAHGVRRVDAGGGVAGEDITVHTIPLAGIRQWLAEREAQGAMVDLKVWAGLAFIAER